jgi:hypothetical protein
LPDTAPRACPLRELELRIDKILMLTKHICIRNNVKIKKSCPISREIGKGLNLSRPSHAQRVEKQKGLGINQVPITTNPSWSKYYIFPQLLAVTIDKEESPYKPETALLCVRSRSKNAIALIIAPKE